MGQRPQSGSIFRRCPPPSIGRSISEALRDSLRPKWQRPSASRPSLWLVDGVVAFWRELLSGLESPRRATACGPSRPDLQRRARFQQFRAFAHIRERRRSGPAAASQPLPLDVSLQVARLVHGLLSQSRWNSGRTTLERLAQMRCVARGFVPRGLTVDEPRRRVAHHAREPRPGDRHVQHAGGLQHLPGEPGPRWIDHGHEVFATFTSQREEHLPTMRAWTQWAGQLIQNQKDDLLGERWLALRDFCPWMLGSTEGSELITNQQRPIADQLIARLPGDVRELHLTAPFFDADATAVQRLIRAWSPQVVVLYIGADLNVNGLALKTVLREAPEVRVRRFQPHVFVHAKLIGAIDASGQGVLLSGSANLSQAALNRTDSEPGGNSEIAVLRSGAGGAIRKIFAASGLELVDLSLDALDDFAFTNDHPKLARPFVLRAASWRKDSRIQLEYAPSSLPRDVGLLYDGAADTVSIEPDGSTTEPLADHDPTPVLVGLADSMGQLMSNRVVVDDPAALRETLEGSRAKHSNRPAELEGLENEPLVRLVLWAHDKFIFDPDETAAFRRAQEAAGEDATAEDAQDFWERYAAEELQYDARAQSYKPLTSSGSAVQPVDELLRELEMLLHQAPGTTPERILRVLTEGSTDGDHEPGSGTSWSMEARHRIRAYHLLTKWAAAVGDPRHALVAPNAPVVNYETSLGLIVVAWAGDALELKQLRALLLTLLQAFIGAAEGHGYLGRVNDDDRAASLAALDHAYVEIAAGLA
jgi:hypothetical protein